ncbi:MAG: flotillin family protein [Deltaproteobacteria bacterium]|nr:MAG: flotillin family protein [Deltaproteobacteria bacterium]
MNALVAVGLILAIAVVAIALIVNKLIYICPPNAVLIFSGTHRTVGNRRVGYRLVQGGRGIRIPLLETVDHLDLTNMIIDIKVRGAYSRGGIPLNVEGVANLKISSTEPTIANAIERFLGWPREQVMRVARETLEGNLRGVLATLTPEEVNQDRVKFANSLLHEADIDLKKLGLELDTLKIQNVSDDVGYLDSIGRKQAAEVVMRSRIAEAENKAQVAERNAANWQTQELAKVDADIAEARAEAERRIVDARTKKDALVAEERAHVTAAIAKAQAELAVQRARIEQVRLQLEADRIRPAEAAKQQAVEDARGRAARIIENGRATAEAIRAIAKTWHATGDAAREIFVAQKLSALVGHLMSTVKPQPVDKVTFIDRDLANGDNLAVKTAVASEQLKHTLGVDVGALLRKLGATPDGASTTARPAGQPSLARPAPPAPRDG